MKKVLLVVGVLLILTGCSKTTSINIVDKTLPIYKECISNIEEADKSLIGTHDVNLYLFYLSTCSHCHEELTWLDSIKDDYPYLHINKLEVTLNNDLYDKVVREMNINSNYVPLTIIGDQYKVGFSESTKEKIIAIIEEYSKNGYEDKMEDIIKNK